MIASNSPPDRLRPDMVKAASNQNFSGNSRMSVAEVITGAVLDTEHSLLSPGLTFDT